MEIREVTDKVEKAFKGNGLLIVGGVFGVLFLISYMTQKNREQTETVKITGAYSSYPDTVTNADEITDTMQESTDYQTEQLIERIDQLEESLLSEYQGSYPVDEKEQETTDSTTEALASNVQSLYAKVNSLDTNSRTLNKNVLSLIDDVSSLGKVVNASDKGSIQNYNGDYYKATPYNGVSIVDGLKAIGEYKASSFSSRKRIAKANGINNYTGTAEQNTTLLNKLKSGTLKKG